MKTIALFGATGKTGNHFLQKALEAGYRVKALARTPSNLNFEGSDLQVIKGDVLDQKAVNKVVDSADVVVSLFGHVKGSPKWLQTQGTENIVRAMKASGVEKIISLSGGGLPFEKDQPKFMDHLIRGIMKVVASKILNDAIKHAEVLKQSGMEWIIVRGPVLTNGPEKGEYRVGWVGVNAGSKIARTDLADFILKQVEQGEFAKKMPFVSY